jgi:hypothetical protein
MIHTAPASLIEVTVVPRRAEDCAFPLCFY